MKKSLLTLSTLFILTACGANKEQSNLQFYEVKKSHFDHLVNQKDMPKDPNVNSDITILNRDYPIEIALYKNKKWYYDLPNLGEGEGTWEYENGVLKLFAKRSLFDMHIDVVATEELAKSVAVKFSDRFGKQVLKVEKINLPE